MPPQAPRFRGVRGLALAVLLSGVLGPQTSAAPVPAPEAQALAHALRVENAMVRTLGRVAPASVTILGRGRLRVAGASGAPAPLVTRGAGSGVLIRWNGIWVLTNAHVVNHPGRLDAITPDGVSHPLEVRTSDRSVDLALARMTDAPTDVRPVRVPAAGPHEQDEGTWVSAAGNPFLLARDGRAALSLGVISATRPPGQGGYVDVTTLEHDAEVNPGNSGGPLWSLGGNLLGINGSIATSSVLAKAGPSHTGASFAVPVAAVRAFLTRVLGPETAPAAVPAPLDPALAAVEADTRRAIRRVLPATAVCVPHGVPEGRAGLSSGVVVHPSGLVLSDGDAGLVITRERVRGAWHRVRAWQTEVDVRVWDAAAGRWTTWAGRVVYRDRAADTSLVRLDQIPHGGFPAWVPCGRSASLAVGDVLLAMGSAYDVHSRAPPALTAGVLSARDPGPGGFLYTSAAVNEGVNGGALVDVAGRLVGTVSTYVQAAPGAPFAFLGKAVPIDRILAALRGVPDAAPLFAQRAGAASGGRAAAELGTVFRAAGRRIRPSLVSVDVLRARPLSRLAPLDDRVVHLARYAGPVTGLLLGRDGLLVTSLYDLTNLGERLDVLWDVPPGAGLEEGLADVRGFRVHLADGRTLGARLVGHDIRWGFALLRLDDPSVGVPPAPVPAPASSLQRGRMVVAAGDPFGARRPADPLLTTGILSKHHEEEIAAPWRGAWQTDAGVTDGNAGGAAVDLEGRLLGMLTIWDPARHGRHSGVAFIVPWSRILQSVPGLLHGVSPERGLLGVRFRSGVLPVLGTIVPDSAAARAGLQVGDVLRTIDGRRVPTIPDAMQSIGQRMKGERVRVSVERAGRVFEHTVTLGARSER